jgi:hypothetical protein
VTRGRLRGAGGDRGETLIELVLSIVLMGTAGLIFVGTLVAAAMHADKTKGHTGAGQLLASVSAMSNTDNPPFIACAQPEKYQPAFTAMDKDGYTLHVTEVASWTGTTFDAAAPCDANTQALQRITVRADDAHGPAHTVVLTKSRTGTVTLADSATAPAQQGEFALSVGTPATQAPGGVRFAVFAPSDATCQHPLWQTLADANAQDANPTLGAGVQPMAALRAELDATLTDRQAAVSVPMLDIADAFGDQPGLYRWRATYLGGGGTQPSATACGGAGQEIPLSTMAIPLPPQTLQPGGIAVYQPVLAHDQSQPGTVTFTVHGIAPGAPGDPCTTGTAFALPPIQPGPDGRISQVIDPQVYGDYGDYMVTAAYAGDVTHLRSRDLCTQGTLLRVKAASAIALSAPPTGPVLIATMQQGWPAPDGGPVTFTVFSDAGCTAPVPGVQVPAPMIGGQARATLANLPPAGYWATAAYAGDDRNTPSPLTPCTPFPVLTAAPMGAPVAPAIFHVASDEPSAIGHVSSDASLEPERRELA